MSVFTELPEIKKRTFASNQLAFACLSYMPITPGHSLIIPHREVANFEDLTDQELLAIRDLSLDVMKRLKNQLGAEGFNCAWNQGSEYGQSVPHFHLHIVPRTPGDSSIVDYEPRKFLYRPGSRATSPEEELSSLATILKDN